MRTLNTIAIICVLTISSTASDLASSFEQAPALADAQENAPGTKDYFVGTLLPYYGETYFDSSVLLPKSGKARQQSFLFRCGSWT